MSMENATVAGWKLSMRRESSQSRQQQDQPNFWTADSSSLEGAATAKLVKLGSGNDIFTSILPAIEQAQEEVILVTCFWARSETLDQINNTLRRLAIRGQQSRKIRVRICFSSVSLWQKLFHTRSLAGRDYPPSCWQRTLGLPRPEELRGLDLKIKSIFILPFSVMHPKFIIIDRRKVYLPSCNVSWENWFEGCVELKGPVTAQFVRFWKTLWTSSSDVVSTSVPTTSDDRSRALFLPSPHHALSLLDGFAAPTSPPTPLNLFILSVLSNASRSIYIQTPNLTSRVILKEIVNSLRRGTDIKIVTSERLMILEQLVTARTTTARCIRWLIKEHRKLLKTPNADTEALVPIGKLEISFYEPRPHIHPPDPVQSHIKVTIADDEIIVLGSGNLDRASWVTSQELGVAIIDSAFVTDFRDQLKGALQGRLRLVYP